MTRFEKALEFYPEIKKLGLMVHDYNCTWMTTADRLEPKLLELNNKLEKAKQALSEILEFHFYGDHAEKFKQILKELE